jgi:hypothetical protein
MLSECWVNGFRTAQWTQIIRRNEITVALGTLAYKYKKIKLWEHIQ